MMRGRPARHMAQPSLKPWAGNVATRFGMLASDKLCTACLDLPARHPLTVAVCMDVVASGSADHSAACSACWDMCESWLEVLYNS